MASRSTGYMYTNNYGEYLPNLFKELSSLWSSTAGKRNHTANLFYNTSWNEPNTHVPFILMSAFNRLHRKNETMLNVFGNINPSNVKIDEKNETIWIYTMRQGNPLPNTTKDLELVYKFVRMFSKKYLDLQTYRYIMTNINISVCFFIWFFTTPKMFFNKKMMKQTTPGDIQKKMWKSILLVKPPVTNPCRGC